MSKRTQVQAAQGERFKEGPSATPSPPARKSKLATLLELISREGGASLEELAPVTGWLPHTIRAAVTGLRKRGHDIQCKRVDVGSRYFLGSGDQ